LPCTHAPHQRQSIPRLDAVAPVVAELAQNPIVAEQKLEQPFAGLRLPRGPARVVVEQIFLARGEHDTPNA